MNTMQLSVLYTDGSHEFVDDVARALTVPGPNTTPWIEDNRPRNLTITFGNGEQRLIPQETIKHYEFVGPNDPVPGGLAHDTWKRNQGK